MNWIRLKLLHLAVWYCRKQNCQVVDSEKVFAVYNEIAEQGRYLRRLQQRDKAKKVVPPSRAKLMIGNMRQLQALRAATNPFTSYELAKAAKK